MRVGIVRFPGSNCDADCARAVREGLGQEALFLWHKTHSLEGADVVLLPGGFSYGDHLRAGAIARFSPIMQEVVDFARAGGPVIGICNGFQILCEAHLLPGALIRNRGIRFRHRDVHLRVERTDTVFTRACCGGQVLRMPIAHGEGQFVADVETLAELEADGRVVFRYVDESGCAAASANPNGSQNDIAGICNGAGNVVGLMPHPERAVSDLLGCKDGLPLFRSLLAAVPEAVAS
ncbi:MAG: phosphoribosylformylglycinamidine synthase subunit PurQ [Gemmatimonadota bacterium]|nr:phosphoribosylformylglycinamidine synthase subunit PurQ [Gemmatimonadota bacterium]MDH3426853.1 phosphoribosylformylglycinamidine synthase subunit PurQ [Gemmatimonadota bacterium]